MHYLAENEILIEKKPFIPIVAFQNCPIKTSLNVLGKKWTLLILRDIAFLEIQRFNEILRSLPGLTQRVLTIRLRELKNDGLIEPILIQERPRIVRWILTERGKDTIPILMAFITFGAKWYAERIFGDAKIRTLEEIFPEYAEKGLEVYKQ